MSTITYAEALSAGYTHCCHDPDELYTLQQVMRFHAEMSGCENDTHKRFKADLYFKGWNLVEPKSRIANPPDAMTAAYELLDQTDHEEPSLIKSIAPWLAEKLKPILVELADELKHFPYYEGVDLYIDFSDVVYETVQPQEAVYNTEMMSGSSNDVEVDRNACDEAQNG